MSESLVGRFEHLPKRPRSDEARPLLEKIASQVKPIMAKRSWKVGTLAEFLPANPALLGNNMNAGQQINLRLRPPGAENTFYEYDQLVLVMLHELTHIEHGPHDAKFYKLLAELEEEFYDLKRKGYSGEGFHGAGNHLPGIKLSEYDGRKKGLAAAEQRLSIQRKIGKGGVLGGAGTAGKSMKELIAEAAERRLRDDKACHTADSGHAQEVEEEVRKAQKESEGVNAVDLRPNQARAPDALDAAREIKSGGLPQVTTNGSHMSVVAPAAAKQVAVKPSKPPIQKLPPRVQPYPANTNTPDQGFIAKRKVVRVSKSPSPEIVDLGLGKWSCGTCTLLNEPQALSCEACQTPKPIKHKHKAGATSWYCDFCGAGPREMGFWSCTECGWVRNWG